MSADPPLLIAVPSKGRLQENAAAFFARAGLDLVQRGGQREYRAAIQGVEDAEILFSSAAEITARLGAGSAHLGVTGEDLVRESLPDPEAAVELIAPLGFGHADVVVAVPRAWIDVRAMADLDDVAADLHHRSGRRMRVATKYVTLTRRFFAAHGLSDYQVVESAGATEGAPASGAAEIVVDITTTGATLASNGLKVLDDGVILRSQANLTAALRAPWGGRARAAAATILRRVHAAESARAIRELRFPAATIAPEVLGALLTAHGGRLPFGPPPVGGGVAIAHVAAGRAAALAEALGAAGAETVTVARADYVFTRDDPLAARLFARLDAPSIG